jgi:hypothetical protein
MPILTALALAVGLALSSSASAADKATGYYRPAWPTVEGCRDLRAYILAERGQAIFDREGCRVLGGLFPDDYARRVFVAQGWEDVAVEHVDPSRRVWDLLILRDGEPPAPEAWRAIYSDPINLWVTDRQTNAEKGSLGPHEWCPENKTARRRAAASIRRFRFKHGLWTSPQEENGLRYWEMGMCWSEFKHDLSGSEVNR